ncbi:hypothetical protein [Streptomyces sp. NPDC048527]|uniref:hypothetical protein n=1 Tax=Streptomyces sp. NPDC048527 TaxID=3365568 RepID=UPI003722115F
MFLRAMTAVVALGLVTGCDGGTSAPPREDFTKKQLSRAVLEKAALGDSSRFEARFTESAGTVLRAQLDKLARTA